jgi:hypothetical protein
VISTEADVLLETSIDLPQVGLAPELIDAAEDFDLPHVHVNYVLGCDLTASSSSSGAPHA